MEAVKILNKVYWGFYIILLGIISPFILLKLKWNSIFESLPMFIFSLFILLIYVSLVFVVGLSFMYLQNKWIYIFGITVTFLFFGKSLISGDTAEILAHMYTDWIPIFYFFKKLI